MKMPRTVKRYCPKCRTHTPQEVDKVKKRRPSELTRGQRQFRRVTAGYGGFPRPKPDREKPTKRVNLKYKCKTCGKSWQSPSIRSKRFELTE